LDSKEVWFLSTNNNTNNCWSLNLLEIWMATSVLLEVCEGGNAEKLKQLIRLGEDVNTEYQNDTPLMAACRGGQVEIVNFLLNNGAEINQESSSGKTPLLTACENNQFEIVFLLIERRVSLNQVTKLGQTALMKSTELGRTNLIKLLLKHGAKISVRARVREFSALMVAQQKGFQDLVELFTDHEIKQSISPGFLICRCLSLFVASLIILGIISFVALIGKDYFVRFSNLIS